MRDISKSELIGLIEEGMSSYEIAQIFSKGQTTIRYWLKLYDLKTYGKPGGKNLTSENAKKLNFKRWGEFRCIESYDWELVQRDYDEGGSYSLLYSKYKLNTTKLTEAKNKGFFKPREKKEAVRIANKKEKTDETRKRLSDSQKKWLKENPDKCHWKTKDRYISAPCEKLKKILKEHHISFFEEYQPFLVENRFFSADIAFPNFKISLEVNGEQHYERKSGPKELAPYYRDRHLFFKNRGWTVYEIYYKNVYNEKYIEFLIKELKEKMVVGPGRPPRNEEL